MSVSQRCTHDGRGVFKGWAHEAHATPPFTVFYTLFIIVGLLIFHARAQGGILEYQYIMKIWYHRLNGLALHNRHPEIIIKPEEVVDAYANKYPRRFQLLLLKKLYLKICFIINLCNKMWCFYQILIFWLFGYE
jgi:hypothetical protein